MPKIEVRNFEKKYGDFKAVKGINFSIEKGEIVGFVGKNGAGKSTTIRSIMNSIFPTNGDISVNGLNSVTNAKKIKNTVSYIPSDSAFHENVTANDIFKLCTSFSNTDKSKIETLSTYFELDTKKKISELSLGNRKKVSIIQAFLKNSDIVIMDEPTNGLDPLMQEKFFEIILKEKENGKTFFLSSHNLSEIHKYCDRVVIIKDGEIVDILDMKAVSKERKQYVTYTAADGSNGYFEFSGNLNDLIKDLSFIDLTSLEITQQDVSEEFIKYYKEGE